MPGASKALAQLGEVGTWWGVHIGPRFGELVSTNVAVNLGLNATLPEKFIKLGMVRRFIKVGGDPFDTEKRTERRTVVVTGG